jgi:hypothetical protein
MVICHWNIAFLCKKKNNFRLRLLINRQLLFKSKHAVNCLLCFFFLNFVCLQWSERLENCKTDWTAGTTGKPERSESQNDQKVRTTGNQEISGKPEWRDCSLRQYMGGMTGHFLNRQLGPKQLRFWEWWGGFASHHLLIKNIRCYIGAVITERTILCHMCLSCCQRNRLLILLDCMGENEKIRFIQEKDMFKM